MVDTTSFIERLELLMKHYELTASALADQIQVQRSSISHILKGRNKPSLEFVMRVNDSFEEVDLHWLLYGEGAFLDTQNKKAAKVEVAPKNTDTKIVAEDLVEEVIDKIVFFYKDGSFKVYKEH